MPQNWSTSYSLYALILHLATELISSAPQEKKGLQHLLGSPFSPTFSIFSFPLFSFIIGHSSQIKGLLLLLETPGFPDLYLFIFFCTNHPLFKYSIHSAIPQYLEPQSKAISSMKYYMTSLGHLATFFVTKLHILFPTMCFIF